MAGSKKSEIRKRPPALPKQDPYEPLFAPGKYFGEPHMVVRRGELQVVIASLERARRQKAWWRKLWRWLSSPFVKPPVPAVVTQLRERDQPRKKIDASGKVVEDPVSSEPVKEQPSIEIATR